MKTSKFIAFNVFVLCLLLSRSRAKEFTDEEYSVLPRLYHLDDYHSCLSQKDGLYCLAKFQLRPTESSQAVYDLIKEYSDDVNHFNRTFIHRGYCVSARCPETKRIGNATQRLQRCASERTLPQRLQASLHTLHYCRRHNDTVVEKAPDTPQTVFLYIVYVILCINIFATLYDIFWMEKKNPLLMAWSVRSNWQRLTASYETKDPRLASLAPIQGSRVIVTLIVLYVHAVILQEGVYLQNPQYMEQGLSGTAGMIMINGTSLVQMFVMVSSFMCAYNMLLASNKSQLSLKKFPTQVLKRLIRITPVYLLVVGYGATWWPQVRDGPLTPLIIGGQSEICRQKFWYHAFYVNNLFDSRNHCFIQTWFLAVDMQLYIVACFLTLTLAPLKRKALPVYGALFVGSCFLISTISYVKHWKSLMYIANPESIKNILYDMPSYQGLYTSPLGSLPACMMGLFIAHLHYYLNDEKHKISDSKILGVVHHLMIPLYIAWLTSGMYIKTFTSIAFTAAYAGIERFIFSVICATQLVGIINIQSNFRRFFAWRGFDLMARMSLSVMMIHWCVNAIILAPRPYTIYTSSVDIGVDAAATTVITYLLAIPLTVMVELPIQKFLDYVLL